MKNLTVLAAIIFNLSVFAQEFLIENTQHDEVLYRGFENKIKVGQIGAGSDKFQIEGINCEVLKVDNENIYVVKAKSKSRTAMINFISNGQIIDSAVFIVENLPSPSLFWGGVESGSITSSLSDIRVGYTSGIRLKSNYKIVSWNSVVNNESFEGTGSVLSSEMLNAVADLAKSAAVSIQVKVVGADGIYRQIAGSWQKD